MKEVFTLLADDEGNGAWKQGENAQAMTNAQVITALEILKHEIIQSIVDTKKVRELVQFPLPSGLHNGLRMGGS